jgi:ribosomal protein L24E
MPKCFYCKKEYVISKGLTLVAKDGTIKHLCSSKCRKNMKMKRRTINWVTKTKKAPLGVPQISNKGAKASEKVAEIVEPETTTAEIRAEVKEGQRDISAAEVKVAPAGVPSAEGKEKEDRAVLHTPNQVGQLRAD